jgi:hypothetical protein
MLNLLATFLFLTLIIPWRMFCECFSFFYKIKLNMSNKEFLGLNVYLDFHSLYL